MLAEAHRPLPEQAWWQDAIVGRLARASEADDRADFAVGRGGAGDDYFDDEADGIDDDDDEGNAVYVENGDGACAAVAPSRPRR